LVYSKTTLCDPIWQVTLRSSAAGSREELYTPFISRSARTRTVLIT